jgi:hypothetical protein
MTSKEKGRREGDPIPNFGVWRDTAESKSNLHHLQALRLSRRCAISIAMAAIVAPLLHGEVAQ